jgi:hypothetical protein
VLVSVLLEKYLIGGNPNKRIGIRKNSSITKTSKNVEKLTFLLVFLRLDIRVCSIFSGETVLAGEQHSFS